jgi:hypothetical protein
VVETPETFAALRCVDICLLVDLEGFPNRWKADSRLKNKVQPSVRTILTDAQWGWIARFFPARKGILEAAAT